MNIFRSEEHLREWELYNPDSEESILPIDEWAFVVASPLFRNRLEPDIISRTDEYWGDFFERLAKLGHSGSFWR